MDGLPDLSKLSGAIPLPTPLIINLGAVKAEFKMFPDGSETQVRFITGNPLFPLGVEVSFPPSYLRGFINNLETLYERAVDAQETTAS